MSITRRWLRYFNERFNDGHLEEIVYKCFMIMRLLY